MRVGTRVLVPAINERGEVKQVRKFIGCPLGVLLESGRFHWCGYPDVRAA